MGYLLEDLILDEFSGFKCREHVESLVRYNRYPGSSGYHKAVNYITDSLKEMGIDEVEVENYPLDGKTKFGSLLMRLSWEPKSAELRIVSPVEEKLVSFGDIPISLYGGSVSTPKGGITAELVDVGMGTTENDYTGKDVKGKIVLADGEGKRASNLAVKKFGAIGLITNWSDPKVPFEFRNPDTFSHSNSGVMLADRWVFVITPNLARRLRELLKMGSVTLFASVNTEIKVGKLESVIAKIRGREKPDEEVIFIGHMCHPKPGANDGASQSALMLEMARTITSLIRNKRIERPKRSIRFLWCAECIGSQAYVFRHKEELANTIAGMNLDQVGEDQEKSKWPLRITKCPDSLPSFVNDFSIDLFKRLPSELDHYRFIYEILPYLSGGGIGDVFALNDPIAGVPSISLWHSDIHHHTSEDTADKTDPKGFHRIGWVATVYGLTIANAGLSEALTLLNLIEAEAEQRLRRTSLSAQREITDLSVIKEKQDKLITETLSRRQKELKYHFEIGREAMKSISNLVDSEKSLKSFNNEMEDLINTLERVHLRENERIENFSFILFGKHLTSLPKPRIPEEALIPNRLVMGPIDHDTLDSIAGSINQKSKGPIIEAYNLSNNERTVADIAEMVSFEYSELGIHTEEVIRALQALNKRGFIELA